MSRPKAWNGTQWVDPSFWTGTEWKTYIPAVYAPIPYADHQFTSSVEGWYRVDGFAGDAPVAGGGNLYLNSQPAGAFDWSEWRGPSLTLGTLRTSPRDVYVRSSIRAINHGTQAPVQVGYGLRYGNGPLKMPLDFEVAAGQDTGYVVRTGPVRSVNSNELVYWQLGERFYPRCEFWIDWAQIIDAATGGVLEQLGSPGWEPKVKRSDGTWK